MCCLHPFPYGKFWMFGHVPVRITFGFLRRIFQEFSFLGIESLLLIMNLYINVTSSIKLCLHSSTLLISFLHGVGWVRSLHHMSDLQPGSRFLFYILCQIWFSLKVFNTWDDFFVGSFAHDCWSSICCKYFNTYKGKR